MRRRRAAIASLSLAILTAAILAAWFGRFSVANAIVDRKLTAAHVPASYRITRIGPFLERMEDVRIGDPAAPDLVARRIDVTIGYGLTGPAVRRITVDGAQLRGAYDGRGIHLGTLDNLLPAPNGKTGLPDMPLSIRNAVLTLATPTGTIKIALAGNGNPAKSFRGIAKLTALSLQAGGCIARDIGAVLEIDSKGGKPHASGPMSMRAFVCPQQGVRLGRGKARIALSADAVLKQLTLDADLIGAGGHVREVRFAAFRATIAGAHSSSGLDAAVTLGLKSASAPTYSAFLARSADIGVGTPLGPIADRAMSSLAALLGEADATAELAISARPQKPFVVHFRQLALLADDGARLVATERGGLDWTDAGLRMDADIAISGGGLPTLAVRLRQMAAGTPLAGVATMQPYRTGNARLAVMPVRFTWAGQKARFETTLTIDGPIGDGFVRGLAVPFKGSFTSVGDFVVGQGCQTVAFAQLRLSSFLFDAARIPVCGQPIVARNAAGVLRIDAATGPLRLSGRSGDGMPVMLTANGVHATHARFTARDLAATVGRPGALSRISIASLDGTINGMIGGRFGGVTGRIGNVPIDMRDASGSWVLDSALRLSGKLGVSDTATVARFKPLTADRAVLTLRGGMIAASAILREPTTRTEVAEVSLQHDLSRGTGHALLEVPGISFVPKQFQPESLTPLTLGVVANVVGTVSGSGRIDWSPQAVISSGNFGTERIDLAAAFGPVTGIKGRVHFVDLLGLVTAPNQAATIAEVNPGVAVTNGLIHYQLIGGNRMRIEDGHWPFAGGDLRLEPSTLDFGAEAERHLTFAIAGLDAAAFVQQLQFPNISATGTFDGELPMVFDQSGGRIEGGSIAARPAGGTLAYVGELSNAQLGTMGKLAFDALKAIRYSSLNISLDGRLDGEMVSRVRFTGIREATPEQSLITRLIRNLPFRFNIGIRAPFRGLVGSARAYMDPRLLLMQAPAPNRPTPAPAVIQPVASRYM